MNIKHLITLSLATVLLLPPVFSSSVLLPSVQAAPTKPPKACTAKEYRQFDFWLGQWEVKDNNAKVVGSSHIQSILAGCGLSESWTSASGNKGVSYNFYDNTVGQWHQTWIDAQGGALYLDGQFSDGKMVLQGKTPDKKGGFTLQKISWTLLPDKRVTQYWQTSSDDGKTWTDAFLGFYSKQTPSKQAPSKQAPIKQAAKKP